MKLKTLVLSLVASFTLVFSGCGDNGHFEDVGEEIDDAMQEAEEEIEDATD